MTATNSLRHIFVCTSSSAISIYLVPDFDQLIFFIGKRIGALTDHELPETLFRTLVLVTSRDTPKDSAITEELVLILHVVFSKMGTKGKRCCCCFLIQNGQVLSHFA